MLLLDQVRSYGIPIFRHLTGPIELQRHSLGVSESLLMTVRNVAAVSPRTDSMIEPNCLLGRICHELSCACRRCPGCSVGISAARTPKSRAGEDTAPRANCTPSEPRWCCNPGTISSLATVQIELPAFGAGALGTLRTRSDKP